MIYRVTAFHPSLATESRMLDFVKKGKMYKYVRDLRLTKTPYMIHTIDDNGEMNLIEFEWHGRISKAQMAEILEIGFEKEQE